MYKTLVSSFRIALITFGLLETAVRLLKIERPPASYFVLDLTPELEHVDWLSQWKREHDQLRRDFQAYDIYRLRPFSGELIQIDKEGRRRSIYETKNNASADLTTVSVFGGSTVWGSWARDGYTVPSWIGKEMVRRDPALAFRLQNDAEIGFVFSQEFHRAVRHLYEPDSVSVRSRPKMMVFIDGLNDSLSAIANLGHGNERPAGLPWEYEKYRYLFQLGNTGEIGFSDILNKFTTVRLATQSLRKLGVIHSKQEKGEFHPPEEMDLESLSDQVADKYLEMVSVANRTLSSDGSVPVFVLQPVIAYKSLSGSEKKIVDENGRWLPYLKTTYDKISARAAKLDPSIHFIDLSHLFRGHSETLFGDVLHYTEVGNRIVGSQVAEAIAPLLEKMAKRTSLISKLPTGKIPGSS
jgi:hypothetical protein